MNTGPADRYADLGVRRVINAAATWTSIGGSTLPEEVIDAMAAAARSHVDMAELHDAVGGKLAQITSNEAACVTNGCAAAITLGVLACITGGDPARIARLPNGDGLARNVVTHRVHRIPYDRAIELAGGRIVEIGNVVRTFAWELEDAIDAGTAAVFWVAGSHLSQTALSLPQTIEIAHARKVPVIVDAAAQLPPASNLWHFSNDLGADLVLFSGGKALRGPQASGLMLGRADLVAAARVNASPNQYLARALKVGKEEICGVLAAVERYVRLDHTAFAARCEDVIRTWADGLRGFAGVTPVRSFPSEAGQPLPRLQLVIEPGLTCLSADELVALLWDRSPRIAVARGEGESVYLAADTLGGDDSEEEQVLAALVEALELRGHARATTVPGGPTSGASVLGGVDRA